MNAEVPTKECSTCKLVLPVDQFRSSQGTLWHLCKKCSRHKRYATELRKKADAQKERHEFPEFIHELAAVSELADRAVDEFRKLKADWVDSRRRIAHLEHLLRMSRAEVQTLRKQIGLLEQAVGR